MIDEEALLTEIFQSAIPKGCSITSRRGYMKAGDSPVFIGFNVYRSDGGLVAVFNTRSLPKIRAYTGIPYHPITSGKQSCQLDNPEFSNWIKETIMNVLKRGNCNGP